MKPLPTGGYTDLYFSTATIKGWKHLLKPDKYKTIITNSMTFLAEEGSVWFYAFVIMPNHIHWVWQLRGETILSSVQQRMLKFVAKQIKADLEVKATQSGFERLASVNLCKSGKSILTILKIT